MRIDQMLTPNVALGQTKAGIATAILCHPTTQLTDWPQSAAARAAFQSIGVSSRG